MDCLSLCPYKENPLNIIIEPTHLLQPHNDPQLLEWAETIRRVPGSWEGVEAEFPEVSGRALRSLLLNAPTVEPLLATPTFERVAKLFTPNKLFSVYHALLRGNEECWNELNRDPIPQFVAIRNRRAPIESVLALIYVIVSIRDLWDLTPSQDTYTQFILGNAVERLTRTVQTLSHLDSAKDPLRFVYLRSYIDGSHPDEIVMMVDAKVYSEYLNAGYTNEQLLERAKEFNTQTLFTRQI